MLKKLQFLFAFLIIASVCFSQAHINEDFESSDSINLPSGWSKYNNAPFVIDPWTNWTVRDSGVSLPGLATATAKCHSPIKACGVSWAACFDTVNGTYGVVDAWLVTKRIENITTNDVLKFWATGGTTTWYDSIQVWISLIDSTPTGFLGTSMKLLDVYWPVGSTYGEFTEYTVSLSGYAGTPLAWIGFRYYMDCSNAGFFVHVDDVFVGVPGSVQQIGTNVPDNFALNQNYPNPFNPTTTIRFDLAKNTNVNLVVYNSLGQEMSRVFDGYKQAGTYEAVFDASNLSSGIYYYRLTTDNFVDTKKMILVK